MEDKPRGIALICEGETDRVILERIVKKLIPDADVVTILPTPGKGGFGEIKRFLAGYRKKGGKMVKGKGRVLEKFMRLSECDILLLHVDGDVAGGACLPDAEAQWEALNRRLLEWAGREAWPAGVVRAFTLQNLEAWVCAALCKAQNPGLECDPDPASKLSSKDKQAARGKRTDYYREVFAPAIVEHWARVRQRCPVGSGHFEADWRACCEEAL